MKHLILTVILSVAAAMTGCSAGHSSAADIDATTDAAVECLSRGNVSEARRIADSLCAADTTVMSARQLARMSILYMQIAETGDDPAPAEQAIQCYRMARRANADSADAYYSTLAPELESARMTLTEIVKQLDSPRDIPADEPLDAPLDSL